MKKGPLYKLARNLAPTPAKRLYHQVRGMMNRNRSAQEVFSGIYHSKQWGGTGDFDSGAGTTGGEVASPYVHAVTQAVELAGMRGGLFVDLGCGDFRIGSQVAGLAGTYIGCDVVPSLVEHLNRTHGGSGIEFRVLDMIEDSLPEGDVYFIRQVLQHLSNDQIAKILPKLNQYRCVFITEHIPNRAKPYQPNINKAQGPDIRHYWNSGVFLDQPPFSLPADRLEEILTVPGTPVWKGKDPGEIVSWVYRPA
jgi:hypothetical protein